MALTDKQKKFVKAIAMFEMEPVEAYVFAGYSAPTDKTQLWSNISLLLSNKTINDAIDRLRKKFFDMDEVRRDIILEHNITRDLDITTIMQPVSYMDDNGYMQTRLDIKPVSEWSPELRRACVGFDRYGIPKFRDKDSATKELSRMFGLYKDNQIVVQQDTDGIIADALGMDAPNKKHDDETVLSPDEELNAKQVLLDIDNMLDGIGEPEDKELPSESELGEIQQDGDVILTEEQYNGEDIPENLEGIQAKLDYMLS